MTPFSRSISTVLAALVAVSAAARAAAPPTLDGDGDGVADQRDECPYSGAGERVNAQGCAISSDADSDGVSDLADLCPYSTIGAKVDAQGCALDEDFDGVANGKDQCPASAYGERVDSRGCEIIEAGGSKTKPAREEPVPATRLKPSGPTTVTLPTNRTVTPADEAARAAKLAAPPVPAEQPGRPAPVPAPEPAPAPAAVSSPAAVPSRPAAAPAAAPLPAPAARVESRPPAPAVVAAPVAAAPAPAAAAPVVPVPAKAQAAAVPVPAPVVAPRREQPVIEQVPVPPTRGNDDQRATMSPATEDRTPSLPKAAAVALPQPSLPAEQVPPGYAAKRVVPKVEVPVNAATTAPSRPGVRKGPAPVVPLGDAPAPVSASPDSEPMLPPSNVVRALPAAPVVGISPAAAARANAAVTRKPTAPVVAIPPAGEAPAR